MEILDYPFTDTGEYEEEFAKFPFDLDSFQKHSIASINNDKNVLVTAFTGSGKTLVAEYAIMKSLEHKKKIIYTSPIKSLSNQKFYEFKQKFPDASVGIMTGDIKFNPFGNIIIMTTEILRNMLYKINNRGESDTLNIDIDLNKEVDTVVFDEIHYINDVERGKVWEECIIMLPKHIKLVMLSATIDKAAEFATWIYKVRERGISLIPTFKRYVPLKHYFYLHGESKDKDTPLDLISNKLVDILDENGKFYKENYHKLVGVKRNYDKYIKKQHYKKNGIFGPVVDFLIEKNLCPALFFVFSRKKCEEYATCIFKSLISAEEQHLVEKTIEKQLMKLPDYQKYLNLEQFHNIKTLLSKGIAIHHSGLIPVFKELIEILFSQKLIKVLFATETFAVGVNMPTKTVLFTELRKRDNTSYRVLLPQEYTQMAGRAGRRGLDKVGYVIHLPNLFEELTTLEMETMMSGKSQHIVSKFTIDYQFVLKTMLNNYTITEGTLLNKELRDRIDSLNRSKEELEALLDNNSGDSDNKELFEEYTKLIDTDPYLKISVRDDRNRRMKMAQIEKKISNFKEKYTKYLELEDYNYKYNNILDEIEFHRTYIDYYMNKVKEVLTDNDYISTDGLVTKKGIVASHIGDCNPILLTELIIGGYLTDLEECEIAAVLSIFLDTKIEGVDDVTNLNIDSVKVPNTVKNVIKKLGPIANTFLDFEEVNELFLNSDWNIYLGMMEVAYKWASGISLKELGFPTFEGNFVRDMIKVTSICQTIEKIAEMIKDNELVIKIKNLESMLMRDIVSIESLYIL